MRRLVLIAHDARRKDMIDWARSRRGDLLPLDLFADPSTAGEIVSMTGLAVKPLSTGAGEAGEDASPAGRA